MTSNLAKPAVPQTKALAQAKPQAAAQAPVWPPAPAQPVRQAPARFPQPQAEGPLPLGGGAAPQNRAFRISR